MLGTPFTPTLAVTLQGQGLQSDSTATIPARVSGLDTLLAANTYNRLLNDSHRQKLGSWFAVAVVAALVGLVPNCAASVLMTQLYVEGALRFSSAPPRRHL